MPKQRYQEPGNTGAVVEQAGSCRSQAVRQVPVGDRKNGNIQMALTKQKAYAID